MSIRTSILKLAFLLIFNCIIQFPQCEAVPLSQAFQILSNKLDSPGIFRPFLPNFVRLYSKRKRTTSTTSSTSTSTSTTTTTSATTSTTTPPISTTSLILNSASTTNPTSISKTFTLTDSSNIDSSTKAPSGTQDSFTVDYSYDDQDAFQGDNGLYEENHILEPLTSTSANENVGSPSSENSILDAGLHVALTSSTQLTVETTTRQAVKNSVAKKQDDSCLILASIIQILKESIGGEYYSYPDKTRCAAWTFTTEQQATDVFIEDDVVINPPVSDNTEAETPEVESLEETNRASKNVDGNESEEDAESSQPFRVKQTNEDSTQSSGGSKRKSNHPYRLGEWKPVIDVNSPLGIYHPVQLMYDKMYELLQTERKLLEHNLWKEKIKARRELVLGREIVE